MKKNALKIEDHTTVELNEFGNVAKIETTKTFAEKQGTLEKTFHYRIEKEAGLSTDEQTGEHLPVYCQIQIHYENEMSEDTLEFAHTVYYVLQISDEHGIDVAHITPISQEVYE